jgi:hypothetical protein
LGLLFRVRLLKGSCIPQYLERKPLTLICSMAWRRPIGSDDETPFSKLEKGVLYTIFDKLMDQPAY